ncbi:MAG: hypothetical protein HLUCCX14_00090 [Marinobacter excellens HL-55]|uniref:DsrE/DsrF-like family n=1 Tax=Marinobacter excellens HL-55 TaxID=1305731 RepID=A0A0P7ZMI2_9GAMM|nr:MAG: hypothetical protein HLUCCX14_00090 [Marinobacter excellens HL-55]
MTNLFKLFTLALIVALAPTHLMASNHSSKDDNVNEVLVILSSDSTQTQGMAMVLSNTMAEQGAKVNVLLCDEAGDLALKSYEGEALAPRNVTPGQMLRGLLKAGGTANVCALYLPNSENTKDDLIDGVGVAMPPEMSAQMLNSKMRTFTF